MLMIAIAVLVLVAALVFVSIYNGLVRLRNQVERAWSNIDVLLKQRFDEIPQLIQVIEQYTQYESSVIQKLVEARTRYGSAQSVTDKIKSSQDMSLALSGVLAIGENYPDLKSNENFKQLLVRISALENGIADRRETYNDAVATFNTRIEQVPDVFVAGFLNYQHQDLFKASTQEKAQPNLHMNLPFNDKTSKSA